MGSRKAFILVLLCVLGFSISSSRHAEDSREYEDEEADEEETEDVRDSEGEEDQDDSDNRDSKGRAGDEEVVKIPGRSSDINEEAEEVEDEEKGYNEEEGEEEEEEDGEEEGDEGENTQDHRMMDGDEGGMPLPDNDVEVYSPEQTGIEDFQRKVEEVNKANEIMQMTIDEMKRKIDEALNPNNENGLGSSDTSVDSKAALDGTDESYKHRYSNIINSYEEDTTRHLQQADAPQETSRGDAVARQYSEIGEDTNTAPDEDH